MFNLILTEHQKFLQEPIELAHGILLDNLRERDEIEKWTEYIEHSQMYAHLDSFLPLALPLEAEEGQLNWKIVIDRLLQTLNEGNNFYKKLAKQYVEKSPYEIVARSLVFIRFDDGGYWDYHKENAHNFKEIDPESPLVARYLELQSLNDSKGNRSFPTVI